MEDEREVRDRHSGGQTGRLTGSHSQMADPSVEHIPGEGGGGAAVQKPPGLFNVYR